MVSTASLPRVRGPLFGRSGGGGRAPREQSGLAPVPAQGFPWIEGGPTARTPVRRTLETVTTETAKLKTLLTREASQSVSEGEHFLLRRSKTNTILYSHTGSRDDALSVYYIFCRFSQQLTHLFAPSGCTEHLTRYALGLRSRKRISNDFSPQEMK